MFLIDKLIIRELIRIRLAGKSGASGGRLLLNNAAQNYLRGNYSEDEKTLLKNIELLRRNTNSSAEILVMTDYGAGKRRLSSVNENHKGPVQVSRRLGELNKRSTKPAAWSRFFYSLVKEQRPLLGLELGTCTGYTALHLGAAMKDYGGKLITIEGDRTLSALSKIAFEKMRIDNIEILTGSFENVLPKILNSTMLFDFVYIDGNHREEPTVSYYKTISPFVRSGGIMIFDDIWWSPGMRKAWKRIRASEKIDFSVNLFQIGICFLK